MYYLEHRELSKTRILVNKSVTEKQVKPAHKLLNGRQRGIAISNSRREVDLVSGNVTDCLVIRKIKTSYFTQDNTAKRMLSRGFTTLTNVDQMNT